MIIKGNQTEDYINWAGRHQWKLTGGQNNRQNRQHFNTVQERLARPRSCSASSLATWWDCASLALISTNLSYITSINVLYLWLILHRDWSSSCIWAEACISAWILDWRSRTDSGGDFIELVSLSKFDTTSRCDFVVVSLPSICVAFSSGICVRGTNNGFVSLSLWQFFLAAVLSPWKRNK